MHVDIRIKPRRGRGTGLHRSHVGPQGMPGVEIALAVTHLESRAGPSLLGCAGVGQAAANFLPSAFCFQLHGWPGGGESLPNTRPHSPPKINILYRHLASLSSPRGTLPLAGIDAGFLETPCLVKLHLSPPVILLLLSEFPQSFSTLLKKLLILPLVYAFDHSPQSLL